MREVSVCVPAGAVEEVLDELLALAPHGVHEVVRGDAVELRVRGAARELPATAQIAAVAAPWGASVRERDVPDDWRERRVADHQPLVIAGRLAVRPAWAPPPADGLIDLVLEHDDAFGSGGHPTTRACLEELCALRPAGAFADLGCGSGVLAIAAAKLGWDSVIAVDGLEDAVRTTRANAACNAVAVDVRQADLCAQDPPRAAAIAANVPLSVHEALATRLRRTPPSALIASGVLDQAAPAVLRAYADAGLRGHEHRTAGGWAVLVLRRS